MPKTPEDLLQHLAVLGIETATHDHPPLRTVEESKALRGQLPGGHCKNLYLRDKKKRDWLIVALEDREIDLKALSKAIGAPGLSFGRPERLLEALGVVPGAVTPFALVNDGECRVRVVLDREMLDRSPLNYHPLINTRTTAIRPDDLLRFIRDCGHEPEILAL